MRFLFGYKKPRDRCEGNFGNIECDYAVTRPRNRGIIICIMVLPEERCKVVTSEILLGMMSESIKYS